jgi:sugar/nucleoside kinase (ribokinase family)
VGERATFDLVVLAELNPDVIVACEPDQIRFGQVEALVDGAVLTLGSSGAITASAAVAQGLRVALCGVIGDDPIGATTLELLAQRGVDTSFVVRRAARATGLTIVLRRRDGDRAMLTFPGTMAELGRADIPVQLLRSTRHVHVSSVHLQRALQPDLPGLLAAARAAGATTSLDPGWDPDERWTAALPALAHLDYLLPNTAEALGLAHALTGATPADAIAAAHALAAAGPRVVVKNGARGAVAVGPEGSLEVLAKRVDPVDTTGAGDNFDAGFIAASLDHVAPDAAVARGVASGSISLSGHGGTGRHATRDEAIALAAELAPASPVPAGSPAVPTPTGPGPKESA